MTDEKIKEYVEQGESVGKVGGYDFTGKGNKFVKSIDGCFYNVLGFPLTAFCHTMEDMI